MQSELIGVGEISPYSKCSFKGNGRSRAAFCGHARYLSPFYCFHVENLVEDGSFIEEHLIESSEKYTCMIPEYVSNFLAAIHC